jgi:hypothetical protein
MDFLDFSFGSFLYLFDWLGFSGTAETTRDGNRLGTAPIGGYK